ncbi:MAG: DUF5675 family protein [Chloroflexi bacterium]|nr:DUF5675 family protein [Chloroflexota bacterium]
MLLLLTRDTFLPTRTLGRLDLDGKPFGFTCEDLDRGLDAGDPSTWTRKVKRETAIPVGEYELGVRFSPSQGREVLFLVGVPAFNPGCVLVHAGNGPDDTEGCVLAGLRRTDTEIRDSRKAVAWLERHVLPVAREGKARIRIQRDAERWAAFATRAA